MNSTTLPKISSTSKGHDDNADIEITTNSRTPTTTTTLTWTSNRELRHLKWINLIAFTINAAVTYGIGTMGWFQLPTNAELSAKYQTLLTPIGWAFAIWGIIFVMQFIWAVQQFSCWVLPESFVQAIVVVQWNYVFVVIAQIGWTLAFSSEFIEVSLAMMVLLLWNLFVITTSITQLNQPIASTVASPPKSFLRQVTNYVFTEFPFAIHFGWILVATVVNVNVTLVASGVSSTVKYYSALVCIVILSIITVALVFIRGAIVPPLVVIWALFGIYKELESPNDLIMASYTEEEQQNVQYAVISGIAFLFLIIFIQVLRMLCTVERRNNTSGTPRDESYYFRAQD
jgi:translocator protein